MRDFKKSGGVLREREELRYGFIEEHRTLWPVSVLCRVLEVSRSGFYAWRTRPQCERSERREELVTQKWAIHAEKYKDCYGSPRMHRELVSRGHAVSENTVARLMKESGLRAEGQKVSGTKY